MKQTNDSQVEFVSELKRLAARGFPNQRGQFVDRLLSYQFIDVQQSSDMRLHIRTAAPTDIEAAVQRALEISAILEVETRCSATSAAATSSASVLGCAANASLTESNESESLVLALLTRMCDKLDYLCSQKNQTVQQLSQTVLDRPSRCAAVPLAESCPPMTNFPLLPTPPSQQRSDTSTQCYTCGEQGHSQRFCPARRGQQGNRH